MKTSFLRVGVILVALAFVIAACASETGTQWTFAPTSTSGGESAAPAESGAPAESAAPDATAAPAESVVPDATAAPAESVVPDATEAPAAPDATAGPSEPEQSAEPVTPAGGEPRVIELQADSALRFVDTSGQPVPDIAVTPGETILFRIENTAGFAHNFWIGTDEELSVPAAQTDAGIPDWSTGVQELEWVVPEDLSGLKFACTVPGHYYTMQGTFSAGTAEATTAPAESEQPAVPEATTAPAESEQPAEPGTPTTGEARVIELEADAAIRFLQGGQQIRNIDVTPGETVIFRVTNTAGFAHNFYIGADEDLQVMGGTTDTGIPDFETGVQELEWVVPDDISGLRFACTVPGHYYTMQGDFTIAP